MRHYLRTIPSPNAWLRELIRSERIIQRRLASLISCDPAQVNRWISEKEHIPIHCVENIANVLCLPQDRRIYATELALCHSKAIQIYAFLDNLSDNIIPISHNLLGSILIDTAEGLAEGRPALDSLQKLTWLYGYLSDAIQVARCVTRSYEQIMTEANVRIHLQYPTNHFIGTLINKANTTKHGVHKLQQFSQDIMECFRDEAKKVARNKKTMTIEAEMCYHHAIHMLSRYGVSDDLGYVEHIINSTNILEKRMVLCGVIFSGGDHSFHEKFILEMNNNCEFAKAVLAFDAVHYRDLAITGSHFPDTPSSFVGTVDAVLNSIEVNQEYLDISLRKLTEIAVRYGRRHFAGLNIRKRISHVLKRVSSIDKHNKIQKEFMKHFLWVIEEGRS